MRTIAKSSNPGTRIRHGICLAALLFVLAPAIWAQTAADFSGLWKQDNDRCQPRRSGDVTLRIVQSGQELTVETSISKGSSNPKHAVQRYTTDGKVSRSTGADGDEFHTAVVKKGTSLVFSIEEHEDGRILHSKETWTLIENGDTLQRTRERSDGETQILFFRRQR